LELFVDDAVEVVRERVDSVLCCQGFLVNWSQLGAAFRVGYQDVIRLEVPQGGFLFLGCGAVGNGGPVENLGDVLGVEQQDLSPKGEPEEKRSTSVLLAQFLQELHCVGVASVVRRLQWCDNVNNVV
jgi:hypothetical protein